MTKLHVWLMMLAVTFNVAAQFTTKILGARGLKNISDWFSIWFFVAVILYASSFLLVAKVLSHVPISLASPLLAGGTFILAALGGVVFFNEQLNVSQMIGVGVIAIGIFLVAK